MDGKSVDSKLCNERHDRIDARLGTLEGKMEKINSWLIAALTALVLNLAGMITLVILTASKGG